MKKFWKKIKGVVGIVAAIAMPYLAPAVAGFLGASSALAGTAFGTFLGTAGGSALVGAGLGGLTAGLTGGDPLTGALMGGLGGYAGGGGFDGLFGGGQAATSTGNVGGPMTSSLRPPGAVPTAPGAAAAQTAATGAAASAPITASSVLKSAVAGLTDPSTLARITMMAVSGAQTGLSPEEAQLVEMRKQELQQIATTNRELFDQQVSAAQNFMQMAEQQAPNPEQAFAETKIATERQLGEQTRGLGAEEASFARRRAGIRSTQTGSTAAAAEQARGTQAQSQLMQAGLRQLPTSAPEGYAGLALPMYQDLSERARQAQSDTAYGIARANPNLFGGIA